MKKSTSHLKSPTGSINSREDWVEDKISGLEEMAGKLGHYERAWMEHESPWVTLARGKL